MSTEAGTSRRDEMLELVVDYVLEHGIADLTLRSLATAIGSNNRMLLYYFESRDALILTALQAAARRFPTMSTLLDVLDDETVSIDERLAASWTRISSPESVPYHRLFFQVFGLAGFAPDRFADLLKAVGTEWVAHVEAALVGTGRTQAHITAHEIVALWRGLQLTLLSTGDHALVDQVAAESMRSILARKPLC